MTGQEIRHQRNILGITQKQFAKELGVSLISISNWENGRTAPRAKNLEKIQAITLKQAIALNEKHDGNKAELEKIAEFVVKGSEKHGSKEFVKLCKDRMNEIEKQPQIPEDVQEAELDYDELPNPHGSEIDVEQAVQDDD